VRRELLHGNVKPGGATGTVLGGVEGGGASISVNIKIIIV